MKGTVLHKSVCPCIKEITCSLEAEAMHALHSFGIRIRARKAAQGLFSVPQPLQPKEQTYFNYFSLHPIQQPLKRPSLPLPCSQVWPVILRHQQIVLQTVEQKFLQDWILGYCRKFFPLFVCQYSTGCINLPHRRNFLLEDML